MLLAVVILAVLACACFVTYRMLDLGIAGAYEAKFGDPGFAVIVANKMVSTVHSVCTSCFAVMILQTGPWNNHGSVDLVDSRHRGTPHNCVPCAPYD